MTPDRFRDFIDLLGLSQLGVGRLLNVDGRTVRRWVAGDLAIPTAVALLVRVMVKWNIMPDKIERLKAEDDGQDSKVR